MLSATSEFLKRNQEIEEYLLHLEALEKQTGFSTNLMNTMKSSAILMMYNSVESTMTGLIQDVFDFLQANQVDFDELNSTMKTLVLSYVKKGNPFDLVAKMESAAINLVAACFERSSVFSGNIDCQEIRRTLKFVGVRATHPYREVVLKKIKEERNDLAHGNKSFADCGKNYSATQLSEVHVKTRSVLANAIADFQLFLDGKAYA